MNERHDLRQSPTHELARPDLLDAAGAAEHLGTPLRFIRRLVAERRIRFYKVGHYVRFARADLDAFLAEGRVEPLNGTQRFGP